MIEGTNLAHWIDSITFKTLFDSRKKEVVETVCVAAARQL